MTPRRAFLAGVASLALTAAMEPPQIARRRGLQLLAGSNGPSLDLNFVTNGFDPRITFTRSSGALCYDATGTLQTAASNVPRIDYGPAPGGTTNWLLRSGSVGQSPWTWPGGTLNYTTAPDGTATASRSNEGAGSGITVQQVFTFSAGTTYTQSMYAKASDQGSKRYLVGFLNNVVVGTYKGVVFDVTNGTIAANPNSLSASITAADNGFYRCSFSYTPTASLTNAAAWRVTSSPGDIFANQAGDGLSGLLLWGGQIETSATAGAYVPTFGTPANIGAVPLGLLIEEPRTNLIPYSLLASVGWSASASTAFTNAAGPSPDGANAATHIFATDTTLASRQFFVSSPPAATGTTVYTYSVYLRKDTGNCNAYLQVNGGGGAAVAYYDLTGVTAVVGADLLAGFTAKSAAITALSNGWFRATFTFTTAAGTTGLTTYFGPCVVVSATGDNRAYTGVVNQGIYAWGAQLELGAFVTSPIVTFGSAATRAADNATMAVGGWFNASAFSLVVEGMSPQVQASGIEGLAVLDDTTNANRVTLRLINGSTGAAAVVSNVVTTQPGGTAYSANTAFKTGYAAKDGLTIATNGTINTTQIGALPTGLTTLRLGQNNNGGSYLNGYLCHVSFWPRAFGTTELQSKTT